jgi:hypothetical protein
LIFDYDGYWIQKVPKLEAQKIYADFTISFLQKQIYQAFGNRLYVNDGIVELKIREKLVQTLKKWVPKSIHSSGLPVLDFQKLSLIIVQILDSDKLQISMFVNQIIKLIPGEKFKEMIIMFLSLQKPQQVEIFLKDSRVISKLTDTAFDEVILKNESSLDIRYFEKRFKTALFDN